LQHRNPLMPLLCRPGPSSLSVAQLRMLASPTSGGDLILINGKSEAPASARELILISGKNQTSRTGARKLILISEKIKRTEVSD
jgi:hypothetical protein